MFTKYLTTKHNEDLINILAAEDTEKHYSLHINFLDLFEADANLGSLILKEPETTISECEKCAITAQNTIINSNKSETYALKKNIHCRVFDLPICPDLHKTSLPSNQDSGTYLQLVATVVRTTTTKMLQHQRKFICTKCKLRFDISGEYELRYLITPPKKCPDGCDSTSILPLDDVGADNCKDYQEIRIQEQPSKLGLGRMPSSMWVTLEDDLVDVCKPGDNVTICGVLKRRWRPVNVGQKIDVESVFKAYHISVTNNQSSFGTVSYDIKEQFETFWKNHYLNPLEGRNNILKSFCPELFGMHLVKLAVAVVLAGGSTVQTPQTNKIRTRSEPHLLLVGDPGTGKSQILRFAAKLIPRSVLTTGIGSTSAGLTVTAVMENGEWQLEAGALVMADGGICCIDEFNSMKNQDKVSIHEAMEQQSISVAKAGVVCKLNTRCTILAATNPKRGDEDESFGIASPLLSRFDVVLHLRDRINKEWDSMVADYILNGEMEFYSKSGSNGWNPDNLQAYFTTIKQLNPTLTPSASKILSTYYQKQRSVQSRNKARTTVRMLDSLIRLSQGHAKLMYRKTVEITDAVIALLLTEASMQSESSLFGLDFDLSAPFPDDPMETYKEFETIVLDKLQLTHLIDDGNSNESSGYVSLMERSSREESSNYVSKEEDSSFMNSFSPLVDETLTVKRKAEYDNSGDSSKRQKHSTLFENEDDSVVASCANDTMPNTLELNVQKPCLDRIHSRANNEVESTNESPGKSKLNEKNSIKDIFAHFRGTSKIADELELNQKEPEPQISETEAENAGNINEEKVSPEKKLKFKRRQKDVLKESDLLNMLPSVADTLNFNDFDIDEDYNIDF